MARQKLKLDKLNRQRISVLVSLETNAVSLSSFFQSNGYMVEVFTDASKLYDALCKNGPPGFVFISTQVEGSMAKMMPDFVVKRFGTPVFLFRENPEGEIPQEPSVGALPPEVILAADYGPEQILTTLNQFEEVYESRLRGMVPGAAAADAKEPLPPQAPVADGSSRSESLLRLIKEAFVVQNVTVKPDDVLTLHACKVMDPSGQGYFVFGFPVHSEQKDFDQALLVLETRVREAAGEGAVLEHLAQGVPADFFKNIQAHSDEVVSGKFGGWDMVLLYFRNRQEVSQPETQALRDDVLVPVEDWWTKLPLPCSAYVWMKLNDRKVLFIRSGDCMRSEAYERFVVKGHSHLVVNAADLEHYVKIREIIHVALAA